MISQIDITNNIEKEEIISSFSNEWKKQNKKVFLFKSHLKIENVRDYYFNLLNGRGIFKNLAEDATIIDREKQRTESIWMEVRYDPAIQNAYRHSSSAQPLHTDGSYIPNYPTSTLMCCVQNTAKNGETIFLNIENLAKIIEKINPQFLNLLMKTDIIYERSGDKRTSKILYKIQEEWRCNWNYFCVSKNINNNEKNIVEKFKKLLEQNEEIKKEILAVRMSEGDALIWKDQEVLHGRNAFIPDKKSSRFIWKCAIDF